MPNKHLQVIRELAEDLLKYGCHDGDKCSVTPCTCGWDVAKFRADMIIAAKNMESRPAGKPDQGLAAGGVVHGKPIRSCGCGREFL